MLTYTNSPLKIYLYHYLKHLQRFRFRSEFRTEKLCVTLRLKSARQKYKNVLSTGILLFLADFQKKISRKNSISFQLVPCACELNRDIYFHKSPYVEFTSKKLKKIKLQLTGVHCRRISPNVSSKNFWLRNGLSAALVGQTEMQLPHPLQKASSTHAYQPPVSFCFMEMA